MRRPVVPDHTLIRPVGKGAYGEVWLAQNVMGTYRAVKIIGRRQFDSDRPFEREFAGIQRYEPVSRSSGGLVHVLHVGRNETEEYFYYVMELADPVAVQVQGAESKAEQSKESIPDAPSPNGEADTFNPDDYAPHTLRSDLKRWGRLSVADALRLANDVVSGLAQLHRRGLVHRDVKPGNIIFVSGRAKLADIGLVSAHGEGRTFVGTEGYIPPEGPGWAAAHLYALGMVLYETSTGFPPDKFPDIPSEWLTSDAGDDALEFYEIALKACEGQRGRRYQTVEEMQADLALLQSGQSIREMHVLQRRYARLRAMGLAGAAVVACAIGLAGFSHYRARVAAEIRNKEIALRQQMQQALERTEAAEREGRKQLYTVLLEQARATVHGGELGQRVRALEAIRRAAAISNNSELRGTAVAAIALPDLRFERKVPRPAGTTLARFDPSFERIAICQGKGPVEIRSTGDNHLLVTLPASTNLPAYVASWSRDGRFLAVKRDRIKGGREADIEVWKLAGPAGPVAPERILFLSAVDWGTVSFHPVLPRLMASLGRGIIGTFDLGSGDQIGQFHVEQAPDPLVYSPDGERFAAAFDSNSVSVYDSGSGATLLTHHFADSPLDVAWHPSGHWIAIGNESGAVHLLDSRTGETRILGHHKAEAASVAFSPDGDYLISGGWERELICWDLRRMTRAFTIGLDSFTLQFSADGLLCATLNDKEIKIHAFERPAGRREFSEDLGPKLHYAAFSPNGRWLAASASQRIGLWDLKSDAPGALIEQDGDARLYFSAPEELFASPDYGYSHWRILSTLTASNLINPPRLEALNIVNPKEKFTSEAFTSLCLASNQVILTSSKGSSPLSDLSANPHWIRTAHGISGASADGRFLAIFAPYGAILNVYGLPDLRHVAALKGLGNIGSFAFSPVGNELAINSPAGVRIWKTETWQLARNLTNFTGCLYMPDGPDGQACWLTSDFRTAGLYDYRTLELLLPLPTGTLPLAVSRDGRYLAAGLDARHLQVWDLADVRERLRQLGLDWPSRETDRSD